MTAKKKTARKPAAKRNLGGRPEHAPTDATRAVVTALTGYGAQQWYIAGELGIAEHTLRKHYRMELDTGFMRANVAVSQSLFQKATGQFNGKPPDASKADTGAAIWWDKTRNKQSETVNVNQRNADGAPEEIDAEKSTAKEAADSYARTLMSDP